MNVLCTITAYWPSIGGAQNHCRELMRRLARRHAVHVVCHWDNNRTDWLLGTTLLAPGANHEYEDGANPVTRIGLNRREKFGLLPFVPFYYLTKDFSIGGISRVLGKKLATLTSASDLVHNVRIGREPLSFASLQLAHQRGVPFFFTPLHHPAWTGWNYRHYLDLYRLADGIITMTQHERDLLVRFGVRPERIFTAGAGPVLAEAGDGGEFCRRYQLTGPIVLFLGQHYTYKGYATIVAAAPQVWRRHTDTQFVFIGPATPASQRFFRHVHDPRIHQLGSVSLQEKTDALAACTLLCVPSLQESFGGVFLEAWQMGKPVIGGDIPAVREVISDGVDGLLATQHPPLLAEKICYLLDHPALCRQFAAAGLHKVAQHYSWEQVTLKIEAAYAAVLGAW